MNRTVLVTLLAFSLALNAATAGSLVFFWAKAQASPVEISLGQKPMKRFLEEDLGLTPDQLSGIMRLIDERRSEIIELKRKFNLTRTAMKESVVAERIDRDAIEEKLRELNRIHGRIREITIGTVINISEALPLDAGKKFAQYIRKCGAGSGVCAPGSGRGPYGDVKPGR